MKPGEKHMRNEGLKSLLIGVFIIVLTFIMVKSVIYIGFNWKYLAIYAAIGVIAYFSLGLFKKKKNE